MSAHVLVLIPGAPHKKVCRKTARRKVERGQFRWKDNFTIEAIPRAVKKIAAIWHDPRAAFDWRPRPSANYLVMQARWGRME